MPRLVRENLLEAINKYHPKSLSSLRAHLHEDNIDFDDEELVRLLRQLGSEGEVTIVELQRASRAPFLSTLRDLDRSRWFYVVIVIALAESALVLSSSRNPVLFGLRAVFGVLLLGFAPGYSATKAVFPEVGFPVLERVLLSIFLSLVVSIGTGTLLGAFLLFSAGSSTLLISLSTVVLGLVGAYRSLPMELGRQ